MLFDSSPTPLDINFRVAGFPVRVSPWFWVTMALIGRSTLERPLLGFLDIVIWMVAGFVSILVHELGHSISGRWFRAPSVIVLTTLGGYAQYYDRAPPSGWRKLLVCLMGPIAGFLLLGLVVVTDRSVGWMDYHPGLFLFGTFVYFQCFYWGFFNLMPIWPMDGGQALREVFYICGVRRPDPVVHTVSLAIIGAIVVVSVVAVVNPTHFLVQWLPFEPNLLLVLLIGMMGVQNWQRLQTYNSQRRWGDDDGEGWKR